MKILLCQQAFFVIESSHFEKDDGCDWSDDKENVCTPAQQSGSHNQRPTDGSLVKADSKVANDTGARGSKDGSLKSFHRRRSDSSLVFSGTVTSPSGSQPELRQFTPLSANLHNSRLIGRSRPKVPHLSLSTPSSSLVNLEDGRPGSAPSTPSDPGRPTKRTISPLAMFPSSVHASPIGGMACFRIDDDTRSRFVQSGQRIDFSSPDASAFSASRLPSARLRQNAKVALVPAHSKAIVTSHEHSAFVAPALQHAQCQPTNIPVPRVKRPSPDELRKDSKKRIL